MAYEATTNIDGVGTTTQVVVGLFKHAYDAHEAIAQLRANGFRSNQIGAAFRGQSVDPDSNRSDATRVSAGAVDHERENWWDKVKDAFRSDDSAAGRRETRDVADASSFNPDTYSRGEYEYDFADDEFQGSLAGTGISSERAAYLTSNLEFGGAIVTVDDANRAGEAEEILSANHAQVRYENTAGNPVTGDDIAGTDVEAVDAATSTGQEITDGGYADRRPVSAATSAGDRVQLFGEVLRVHKERIQRGEVRVRKDVVTENQTIEVPVVREELVLERVAVPGDTPAPSASIGRAQEIRVPLSEETVRVEKQAVVREEVIVGKREVADVATVSDAVRHEELRVDGDAEAPKRAVTGEEIPEDLRRRG
jgi:uncharacterized protein (TIGR02271 family)